ncbi:hypothetical protein BFQ30_00160 [Haemophilus quentini]|uniref:Uncharacterized protein n=1 Tax=Haemophilus quentini TaxID=123834 RepID=A0ABX3BSR4_9PAST|nr:hypothetical protein [Haemophilus quentini]EGT79865.1 Hypothetical protein GGE_1821 [Haemophilus haemolyticus M21639]OEY75605.1 hypothetical protein BFQ29_09355 [Haemophilus quentini]OEY77943.1 hypothetical protein BFQ30_00160 [Haemophilus quentini]ORC37528.1 hypothetical protein BES36_003755 [Haemophilus quentini]
MSNNAAQTLPNIDSLTDFIYIDQERTRNILAQFINKGVLTAFKEEFTETDSSTGEIGFQKWAIGKRSGTQQDSQKYAREFDVSHSLPFSLLNLLDQYQFIHRDIATANIGNIVLFSGDYRIFDVSIFEKVIPLALIMHEGKKSSKNKEEKAIMKALELFPKNLQIDLIDENDRRYWMALKKESLLINTEDLLLSNGTNSPYRWFVVGIVDEIPNGGKEPNTLFSDHKTQITEVSNLIKEFIGRNEQSYSITPILIFRKITK